MKPGKRIRLIKECAESLIGRQWHEVQPTLRAHTLDTYELDDRFCPDELTYLTEQIEKSSDQTLVDLHEYLLGADVAPGVQIIAERPWGRGAHLRWSRRRPSKSTTAPESNW